MIALRLIIYVFICHSSLPNSISCTQFLQKFCRSTPLLSFAYCDMLLYHARKHTVNYYFSFKLSINFAHTHSQFFRHVWLFLTPWTGAHQVPLPMWFFYPRSSCCHRWGSVPLWGPVPTDTLWRCPEHRPSPSFGSQRKPRYYNPERLKALSLTRRWVPITGECAKEYPEEITQGECLGRWVFMGVHQTRDCLTVFFPISLLFQFGLHLSARVNLITQETG